MIGRGFFLALLFLFALALPTLAADTVPEAADETAAAAAPSPAAEPAATPAPSFTSTMHGSASAALIDLSTRIDTFFVDPNIDETFNRTRLRLRGGVDYSKSDGLSFLPRLSLNFDLPRTRRRFNLFFTRDQAEEEEKASTILGTGGEDELKFNLRSGLRYIISQSPSHNLQWSIGSKLVPEVEPFTELRGNLIIPLDNWLFRPTQFLFWRENEKFGETTRLDFDYPVGKTARVRWRFEGTFSQSSDGFNTLVETSYARQFKMQRGFQMALRTQSRTRPDHDVVVYQATIDWRQLIYQDWLFFEAGTRLSFPEDDDYMVDPAVSVVLEVNFGNFSRPQASERQRQADPVAP
ncbi:MAG TPA: hypothetical protein DCF93_10540 [Desulfuromonas sp.]|nr:hypothetical protein [Desulfuromonas sp.]